MKNPELQTVQQLAARIRMLREAKGWSQAVLAEKAGLSDGAIKMIETARRQPRAESLEAIARALSVSVSNLYQEPMDLSGIDPEILDALRRADPLSIRLVRAALRLSDVVQQDVRVQKEQKLKTQR